MSTPTIGSAWHHPSSGGTYRVILIANANASDNRAIEYPIIINYQNVATQQVWAVTLDHWNSKTLIELDQTTIPNYVQQ
jgi:hypothetical protein